MVYGTPFEQLEDDEKSAISKRPKGVQEEIVTDERGRRRFHGAFTGGFSAGYFNTAGSKHGWVPQTFKSTRDERAEKLQQAAEDFMDDEDLGEFGIAARRLRPKVDFMDSLLTAPGEQRLLAWERSSTAPQSSVQTIDESGSLMEKLTEILRPVSDSVGVRLLKKMGWRPGKGIGMKMSRYELEKQKVTDAKSAGRLGKFDEEAIHEVEYYAKGLVEFSPDDVPMAELSPKEDVHGLGYKPLQESGVLSQKYGIMGTALKIKKKSKGIRGQAFGVGAFEEDDDDIYTNYDLTQYDFEVGSSSSIAHHDVPKFDSTFMPASTPTKNNSTQKFFVAPQLPAGWRPLPRRSKIGKQKKPIKLPGNVAKASERLTPFQRAKLLGDRDHSVMELISSADREKLKTCREQVKEHVKAGRPERRQYEAEPFEEEPIKAHRFKQYVNYLKRGIPFPQPVDMTRLEWEHELAQFQEALTPELRSLLQEVRDRQKPLAKIDFARPIAEHLNSRFAKESGDLEDIKDSNVKDSRIEAVRLKQFGQATRQKYEWHPSRDLCKRFNVSNPYPDSQLVGAPGLSRRIQKDYSSQYSIMDLGGLRDTAAELSAQRRHHSRFDQKRLDNDNQTQTLDLKQENKDASKNEEKSDETIVPIELLTAIFGDDDAIFGDETSISAAEEENREDKEQLELKVAESSVQISKQQKILQKEEKITERTEKKVIITINDLVEDDDVYGPAMPSSEFLLDESRNGKTVSESTSEYVITVKSDDEDRVWKEPKSSSKKTNKKEKKKKIGKKKERNKEEKVKRKRRKHYSPTSSSSSSE